MDLTNSLQKLAGYRPRKTQRSKETYDKGLILLKNGGYSRQGDEGKRLKVKLGRGLNASVQ